MVSSVGDVDQLPNGGPQLVSPNDIVNKEGLVLRDRGKTAPLQARNEPHGLLIPPLTLLAGARVHVYGIRNPLGKAQGAQDAPDTVGGPIYRA